MHKPNLYRRFGPYILLKSLGCGGMAEVYLAVHLCGLHARRLVALKSILPPYNGVEAYVRLFYHEASVGLRLRHAHVQEIFDCGVIEGRHSMVMEYMQGVTVSQIFSAGIPIPCEIAAWIALCALEGLSYLHKLCDETGNPLHIVHRDVSPDNIFVDVEGNGRIFDYGVALCGSEVEDIQKGMIVGKYAYMSPEQCHGEAIDERSDVFSLAVVLYEMCTGRTLFAGESDVQTINAVLEKNIDPPNKLSWEFPSFLSQSIMRGLERDPGRRYATADEFAWDLRSFLKMRGVLAPQQRCREWIAEVFAGAIAEEREFLHGALSAVDVQAPTLEDLLRAGNNAGLVAPSPQTPDVVVSKVSQIVSFQTKHTTE